MWHTQTSQFEPLWTIAFSAFEVDVNQFSPERWHKLIKDIQTALEVSQFAAKEPSL